MFEPALWVQSIKKPPQRRDGLGFRSLRSALAVLVYCWFGWYYACIAFLRETPKQKRPETSNAIDVGSGTFEAFPVMIACPGLPVVTDCPFAPKPSPCVLPDS